MKDKDQALYKELVTAYYNNGFESKLEEVLEGHFDSKEEARKVLGALCGVEVEEHLEDHPFALSLVDGITKQRVREKIVQKVRQCSEDCDVIDGKTTCQNVCPFDAIMRDEKTGDKWVDEDLCMSCGRCVKVCDHGNYMETSQFLPLAELLKGGHQVMAMVAPAIAGQFGEGVTLDQLREAFIKMGFMDMVEVAVAADVLSLKEALEFNEHVQKEGDFMITSCCCPMWVAALRKVYYHLIPDVSPSVSPMIAMARILKALHPGIKTVFIGPCIAKKAEAKEKDLVGDVDYVLTFEEVKTIFEALTICPSELKGVPSVDYASTGGRLYARTGGVSQAVYDIVDELFPKKREIFSAVQVDGMKSCKDMLQDLEAGKVRASFIEGMGCQGGCVGGPKAIIDKDLGKKAVDEVAYDSAVKTPTHSEVLLELLAKLGIKDVNELKHGNEMFERSFK